MLAVYINCLAVIAGSLIGILVGKHLNDDFKTVVFSCSGVVTIVMGIEMALGSTNYLVLLIALLLGGFSGYALKVEDRVLALGGKLEKLTSRGKAGNGSLFAQGFMNASILFCSGAMAVVGSIQAGTSGQYETILIKSVMDGCMAVVFAAIYGIGTAFSALTILVYQGLFTLAGGFLEPVLGEVGIAELSASGGVLLIMIGLGLLDVKKFKNGNYLPAMVFAPVLAILTENLF